MSTTGEIIQKMINSFMKGNSDSFRAAAHEFVIEERKKNHHILARDIERLLQNGTSVSEPQSLLTLIGTRNEDMPRDKERGVMLVEIKEPKRDIESLILTDHVREKLELIIDENRKCEILHTYGLNPISRVLFCGPPGCGKTVGAEVVAKALYLPLVLVRFDAVVSSYLGETAANLRKVFNFAKSRPMVILFDEFDAIGKYRTDEEEHGELKRVVNSFLQMLDSFHSDTLVIAATNHQRLLDNALWRRFDEIVFFDLPNKAAIEEVIRKNLKQMVLEPSIDLVNLSKNLIGLSHSDAERIAVQAIKTTVLCNKNIISIDIMRKCIENQKKRTALTREIMESPNSCRIAEKDNTNNA